MRKLIYRIMNRVRRFYFELRYSEYRSKYDIENDFVFNGVDIEFYGAGEIVIKGKSYIGNRSALAAVKGCSIHIGRNCSISHNVRIYTSNRNPRSIIENGEGEEYLFGDIVIGNNVWIGANVFIVQGVHIGNNVVIGANSVVTKDIQSNSIAAGVPCRVIRDKKNSNLS